MLDIERKIKIEVAYDGNTSKRYALKLAAENARDSGEYDDKTKQILNEIDTRLD